jgi:two-component system nitrate/nitrite response regulator NarL
MDTEELQIRLLIVEDDTFTRTTLQATLQHLGYQVSAAENVRKAIHILANERIDAAVIDLDLGAGPNGLDLIRILEERNPEIAIVLLTSFVDPRLLETRGNPLPERCIYVLKQSLSDPTELKAAITDALAKNPAGIQTPRITGLTEVQIETMRLVALGHSNSEIAKLRFVSEKAVEQTVSKIAKTLNLSASNATNQRVQITREYFRLSGRKV